MIRPAAVFCIALVASALAPAGRAADNQVTVGFESTTIGAAPKGFTTGLTKADSLTHFDDLEIRRIP